MVIIKLVARLDHLHAADCGPAQVVVSFSLELQPSRVLHVVNTSTPKHIGCVVSPFAHTNI
jgi:hypothetical protein